MSALTEFYAVVNWLNRFGIKGPFYGPRGHLGLDLKAKGRQNIPALRSGTVQPHLVRSYYVGYTLSVRHALGDYDGYVHLYGPSRAAPGTVVAAGDFIGEAATWGDFTGISWAGAHLHLTHGNTPRCVFGEGVDDPAPYVRAAIATLTPASTNKTPLEDTLSAAEVNDIKNHATAEANRVLAEVKAVRATQLAHQNLFVEEVNAVDGGHVPGGLRGLIVNGIAVSQVNQNLLAKDNGGGIRAMVSTVIGLLQRIAAKLGA
jgi:hypothetical protein